MFEAELGQSRAPRGRVGAGVIASVVLHAGLIAFAVWMSLRPAPQEKRSVEPDYTFVAALPSPPPPPPAGGPQVTTPEPTVEPRKKPVKKPDTVVVPREPDPEKPPEQPEPEPEPEPAPETPAESEGPPGPVAGVPEGVPGGHPNGVPGGTQGGTPGGTGTHLGAEVLPFGEGMSRPKLLSGRQPVYTREALEAEIEGLMIVQCVIDIAGRLNDCRVLKPLPHMERAVLDALGTWKMTPVTFQGRPVSVKYNIPIRLVRPQR